MTWTEYTTARIEWHDEQQQDSSTAAVQMIRQLNVAIISETDPWKDISGMLIQIHHTIYIVSYATNDVSLYHIWNFYPQKY